jgi:putative transposase
MLGACSDATYYNWKASMAVWSELRRLKDLEGENRRLKQIVADQALKWINSKNFSGPK